MTDNTGVKYQKFCSGYITIILFSINYNYDIEHAAENIGKHYIFAVLPGFALLVFRIAI
ncbi:MAG: hypothetical protein MUC95_06570 [Spirochaetes bacterium]|nr:hypothetical protein [Spirochaetota bacterium]